MTSSLIIAHRGASGSRPENTIVAFDLALQEGADGIELDLQLSRDDQVVVFHDQTLSMLGMKHRRVAQYDREQLQALDVGVGFGAGQSGAAMPDLDEVLARYGNRTDLYLEIKPAGEVREPERARRLAQIVARRLAQHAAPERLYVLSFSAAVLQTVAVETPELRCVRNVEWPAQLQQISDAQLRRLHGVCVDIRHFSAADVARVHAAGKRLYAYTVDKPAHIRHALDLQVAGVISNWPARTRQFLATA